MGYVKKLSFIFDQISEKYDLPFFPPVNFISAAA